MNLSCPISMTRYGRPCGGRATTIIRAMCVHEHLWEGAVCERHVQRRNITCPWCKRSKVDPHICPLTRAVAA